MEIEEDREALLVRHRKEVRELENKSRFMLKQAKNKAKKAEAEAEIAVKELEQKQRHDDELGKLAEAAPIAVTEGEVEGAVGAVVVENVDHDPAANAALNKKEKAKRKKERDRQKEEDRERRKADILENAGPRMRDIELDDLNRKLLEENLEISEIAADGNCMYRAVAHQLQFNPTSPPPTCPSIELLGTAASALTFTRMREITASFMRAHRDDFEPFIDADECEHDDPSFEVYCDTVASPVTAKWGGQLELRALAAALHRPIWVYDALQPTVKMGDSEDTEPIRLSFHRHFYSLGEHYNSVMKKSI